MDGFNLALLSSVTAQDLDIRASKITDPGIDLKTRHNVACELRELIDSVKDHDAVQAIPHMLPVLIDCLRSGEPSFQKDSLEFAFRRNLLEILHRIPTADVPREQVQPFATSMLQLVKVDNEENGVICCKAVLDLVRINRLMNDEVLNAIMDVLREVFRNMPGLAEEILSEDSPVINSNLALPSTRSFKVFAELAAIVVALVQFHRATVQTVLMESLPLFYEVLNVQSPAQQKAREDFENMGRHWSGMAPTIRNPIPYADLILGQVKLLSFLAFLLRGVHEQYEAETEQLLVIGLRLLQDCQATATVPRKEIMMIFRHFFGTNARRVLLPQIDKLLDERVILGTSLSSQESVRQAAFGSTADLLHHLRGDLTPAQLLRVSGVYLRHLHNPYLSNQIHVFSAKMIFNMIEVMVTKVSQQEAAKLLMTLLDASVDKLESSVVVLEEVLEQLERKKKGEPTDDTEYSEYVIIEKTRPVAGATYAVQKPEELLAELRLVFRAILHGFKATLIGLKKCDASPPDGTIISRVFEGCVRSTTLFVDSDTREVMSVLEEFSQVLLETNLHVFQEVWTRKVDFMFEMTRKLPFLMTVTQTLFTRDTTSPTLVAIILRFLIDRLDQLGDYDDQTAAVAIKWFKMVFGAVTLYPASNEPILAAHLGKLIMDCFPLAAKASKPTNYFHLLRALFRAIGGGGGKFEHLYREVLPLLPDMLECLSRQLRASDGVNRDMIVELCLTVPLRLTHLLPHLVYLMQPLAFALRGSPELVSQGLRTLELCIDNLTPDFLDPQLNTVLRELMEALHGHLKPLPASHHHAHTTIRILGKLGGRNRKLLERDPELKYHAHSNSAKVRLSFGGFSGSIELGSVASLAFNTLNSGRAGISYRVYAYDYLETCAILLLNEGVKGPDRAEVFVKCLEGIFDAIHLPELQERAENFITELSRLVFAAEIRRIANKDSAIRRYPGPLFACYLDALPHGLARDNLQEAKKAQELIASQTKELAGLVSSVDLAVNDIKTTLYHMALRFSSLCLDDAWARKSAGCNGIRIMTGMTQMGVRWISERVVDLVRTLLHVLKDMPYDLPNDVSEVSDVLARVLQVSSADILSNHSDPTSPSRNTLVALMGIFFAELSGQNPIVRRAAQTCIEMLSQLTGKPIVELLMPHRERMLTAIYTKPLRALPFPIQIGMIEAVRYCLSLDPPLPELNDELLRLLHEALALADADDMALISRGNPRQAGLEVIKLRVACIKLLTASMPLTDFFSKQHQTRQRVTGVYFKSLYSPTPEVKDVAHEGLRMRLSIPGLEGLARLLELLTNYFKVEIGHKLLDHFRFVADPQMLQASSRLPLSENEGITKLVRLANIFHLLPSAANIFLENLVNAIVQTEAQMHFSSQSPFSDPLAKYLDRYPAEAIDFFMRHLQFPRHVRTLRSILQAELAPNLLKELVSRTGYIVTTFLGGRDPALMMPGLQLCSDMASLVPSWLEENDYAIQSILGLWRTEPPLSEDGSIPQADLTQRYGLMQSILMNALERTLRVDLVFELVVVFSRQLPVDLVRLSQFLYRHVALSSNLTYRRNVLVRFITWFEDPTHSWSHKTAALRFVITPTVLVHASHAPKDGLLDTDIVQWFHTRMWIPVLENAAFAGADDMFRVELLHLTTVMVQHYTNLLNDAKKDVIKCAFHCIASEDTIVKHTAYLLAARCLEAWEGSPEKFILTLWSGLLSRPHAESKAIIRQALDILAPVLERSQSPEAGFPPQWAKTTRRLLAEESGGWSQIGLIYGLMIRHPSLFYPVRALFVPHIVNNMSKLGFGPANAGTESRQLTLDVLQVVFEWEKKAEAFKLEHPESVARDPASGWSTPLASRESMVSYVLRLACVSTEPHPKTQILPRALALLRSLVGPNGWPDVTIKLNFFTRPLQLNELNTELNLGQAQNTARVLQLVAAEKSDEWYIANVDILSQLVRKGMLTEDLPLQDALHPVFDRLMHLYPLPKEDEEPPANMSEFFAFVNATISESIRNSTSLRGALLMLRSIVQVNPERIQTFSAPLMKLLQSKTKDHVQVAPSTSGFDNLVRLLIAILEISQISIAHLGDQRKQLVMSAIFLVEKSKSGTLCRYLLDMARDWALNRKDGVPTMKEKANLIQKMTAFEKRGERGEPLFQSYLELIYDIYNDSSLRRTELTTRLEHPFLLGCRATDPSTRERFMDLLDASVPRSLFSRMSYILGVQNWEALNDHNWIFLALHLLLGSVDGDIPLIPDRKVTLDTPPIASPFNLARSSTLIRPMQRLFFLDPQRAHEAWVSIFPSAWACLSRREQVDITHHMITLLSKEYHINQAEVRPNVIQTLLEGIYACSPPMILPPHLVKYLAKNFGAWHVALQVLESSLDYVRDDELIVRDTVYDSLAEVYAELGEVDLFYGLWRKRSLYPETNMALAFEQSGMWEQASSMYESAQNKARAGVIPFSEPEYCLWEDHWILAAEKLQQWDTLHELGRSDNNYELMLESAWRIKDWAENRDTLEEQINMLPESGTPRRRIFEAFIALLKMPAAVDKNTEFTRILEDAMQLSLRKWTSLPPHLSAAHVPLLQHFQQFVELQEAVQIFGSLSSTTASNLEKKSSDLKMVLQAWRERLPHACDDISIWSDLVAWRQNVFHAINKAYIPLIASTNQGNAPTGTTNTFGYRGYHETAWIINRFAHVARKHELLDVCFTSLSKIYTLPNIEISEAFLKLREQARCHYQKPGDLQAGLEVINNTNLMYFSTTQKAEFYTLKGMFHAKFERNDEANQAFGQAVQLDMQQPKAWAAWGKFNDRMFKERPTDMPLAANAVSCYLQAAGLYKSRKSRPLLTRVLWLLSVDDTQLSISRAFDTYKGDAAFWYWLTLIPQLCLSVSQREVKQARYILLNLAKLYPQALFFHLRTTREDLGVVKRQAQQVAAQRGTNGVQPQPTGASSVDTSRRETTQEGTADISGDAARPSTEDGVHSSPGLSRPASDVTMNGTTAIRNDSRGGNAVYPLRHSWDHIEEVGQILKTAFPLLIMSLETIVDQILQRFKATPEEEIYRLVCMLLQDALQQYVMRMSNPDDDGALLPQTEAQLSRLAPNLSGHARKDYDEDFLKSKPTLYEYIQRLQVWRDKYEKHLSTRPRVQSLDVLSHYLTDFQHGKFDEIEVPGQYTENDSSYVTFGDIYEEYCEEVGIGREDPIFLVVEKVKQSMKEFKKMMGRPFNRGDIINLKRDLFGEIQAKLVPENIMTRYLIRTMDGPSELWRMRKQFALQLASTSFMTYVLCLTSRLPSRFQLSRATGQITMSEILPGQAQQAPLLASADAVPFRFTPNMQHVIGPVLTEGILAPSIMAIARCLTEPEASSNGLITLRTTANRRRFVPVRFGITVVFVRP
ncbi:hypothetical protein EW026_g1062 [Hermanssonia centrifuga]|uniref:FAT domain-containing protein n=1 Tax=Hermanssonia centrifuga TaxID=98765 RepID=A0A4V3XBD9_9APHY|nr:hypothetical protein EW026_g1062 [Hermanssonia centrifuga]